MQKQFYCKILVNFCIHLIVSCNDIWSIFRPLGPSDGEDLWGRIFDICIVNNYVINTKFKFLGLSLRNLSQLFRTPLTLVRQLWWRWWLWLWHKHATTLLLLLQYDASRRCVVVVHVLWVYVHNVLLCVFWFNKPLAWALHLLQLIWLRNFVRSCAVCYAHGAIATPGPGAWRRGRADRQRYTNSRGLTRRP